MFLDDKRLHESAPAPAAALRIQEQRQEPKRNKVRPNAQGCQAFDMCEYYISCEAVKG